MGAPTKAFLPSTDTARGGALAPPPPDPQTDWDHLTIKREINEGGPGLPVSGLTRISGKFATAGRVGMDPDTLLPPKTDLLVNRIDYIRKQQLVGKTTGWIVDRASGLRGQKVTVDRRVKSTVKSPGATVGLTPPVYAQGYQSSPWWQKGAIVVSDQGTVAVQPRPPFSGTPMAAYASGR